jgi:hypothetical protein
MIARMIVVIGFLAVLVAVLLIHSSTARLAYAYVAAPYYRGYGPPYYPGYGPPYYPGYGPPYYDGSGPPYYPGYGPPYYPGYGPPLLPRLRTAVLSGISMAGKLNDVLLGPTSRQHRELAEAFKLPNSQCNSWAATCSPSWDTLRSID